MLKRKNPFLDIAMMSVACVYGCLNTTSYSYTVTSSPNDDSYDVYEPVVFSFCEVRCTNDSRCTYFKFTNHTKNCEMFDKIDSTKWRKSCYGCITGMKVVKCLSQPEEATNIPVQTTKTIHKHPLQTTTKMETMCFCVCKETNHSADEILKERLKALSVNVSNLSATKRKLSCAEDHRPSANNIGYFGLSLLGLLGGLFVVFDCVKVFSNIIGR